MKQEDFEGLAAQILKKEQQLQSENWAKAPKDYLLILSETDDPQDLLAYEIYEVDSGFTIGWETEEEQTEAVRRLLEHQVAVVKEIPPRVEGMPPSY